MKQLLRPCLLSSLILLLGICHAVGGGNSRPRNPNSTLATFPIHVEAGWNLLSLPVRVTDGTKSTLFPVTASKAFIYQDGYETADTLENGEGFWLKFDSAATLSVTGESVLGDTIAVQRGWNMIGALTVPIAVSAIQSDPPGIIASEYFSYSPGSGYQTAVTLQPGLGYWVRANQNGSLFLLTSCPGTPTVSYAGKTYNTIQIGSQCWLGENLDVGTMVDSLQNQTDNSVIEKYCSNNNPANCSTYGGLYQWNEAMQYSTTPGTKGICPTGWHIPTIAEFTTLRTAVGDDGNALKAIGQGTGGGAGTNTSGFSALLAGNRSSNGYFYGLGFYAYFWSSTEHNATNANRMNLSNLSSNFTQYYNDEASGFSVRCLED